MTNRIRSFASSFALSLPLVLAACSAGSSGVPGGTLAKDLTEAQKGDVCDYSSDQFGGYGKKVTCGDTEFSSASDRATCVKGMGTTAGCKLTVSDLEAIARAAASCGRIEDQAMAQRFMSCVPPTPAASARPQGFASHVKVFSAE